MTCQSLVCNCWFLMVVITQLWLCFFSPQWLLLSSVLWLTLLSQASWQQTWTRIFSLLHQFLLWLGSALLWPTTRWLWVLHPKPLPIRWLSTELMLSTGHCICLFYSVSLLWYQPIGGHIKCSLWLFAFYPFCGCWALCHLSSPWRTIAWNRSTPSCWAALAAAVHGHFWSPYCCVVESWYFRTFFYTFITFWWTALFLLFCPATNGILIGAK